MAKRDEIVAFLNEFLEISKFQDKMINGLQVIGKDEIQKVVLGVSPSLELFEKAAAAGADMIILHHGVMTTFDEPKVDAIQKARLKTLFDHDMNLLAYHLPLDAHFDSGNTAQAMRKLGLTFKERFASYGGQEIGLIGSFTAPKGFKELVKEVIQVFGNHATVLEYGKEQVSTVAIVTGAGGSSIREAIEKKADVFLTGEHKEHVDALAKEAKINVIFSGHYHTEKFGVQALGNVLEEKFKVKTEFIDIPCVL